MTSEKTVDFTYTTDGMFTKFIPHTPQDEIIWNDIAKKNNGVFAELLGSRTRSLIARLRKAGYTVAKAKSVTTEEIDAILAELK